MKSIKETRYNIKYFLKYTFSEININIIKILFINYNKYN